MAHPPKRTTKEIAVTTRGDHPLLLAARRLFRTRKRELAGTALVALVALITVLAIHRAPDDCRRSREWRTALDAVRGARERISGETLGRQLGSARFRCVGPSTGEGVFIAASRGEESGDEALVWFVDAGGRAHNVNLLAEAWTPDLPPAPYFEAGEIARVTED